MYRDLPKRDSRLMRLILSAAWLTAAVAGYLGIRFPSAVLENETSFFYVVASCSLLILGGALASLGAFRAKAYAEMVGGYIASSGMSIYVLSVLLSSIDIPSKSMGALLLAACLLLMLGRVVFCEAHIKKLKAGALATEKEKK